MHVRFPPCIASFAGRVHDNLESRGNDVIELEGFPAPLGRR